jgi:hypothetical protein
LQPLSYGRQKRQYPAGPKETSSERLFASAWRRIAVAGEVLRLSGRAEDADQPTREALELYELKENAVSAERARALRRHVFTA